MHGTEEQKKRWLTPLIEGSEKACFGVTEPNAGLDTTKIETFARRTNDGYVIRGPEDLDHDGAGSRQDPAARRAPRRKRRCKKPTDGMTLFYTDIDRSKIEVRRIPKMGRAAVDSNAVFIDDLHRAPTKTASARKGKGFRYLLDSLNPERILFGIEAMGLGRDALKPRSGLCA